MECSHNKTILDRGKFVTKAIPDRLETLAVAAPGEARYQQGTMIDYCKQAHQDA